MIDKLRAVIAMLEQIIEELEDDAPAMTLYSQRDPRWRNEVYAGGLTFGAAGCYVTCVSMLATLAGYEDTPPQTATKLRMADCFIGGMLLYPDRISQAYPLLGYDGTLNWRRLPADIIRLRREVEDSPVIIEVEFRPGGAIPPDDQHFVILESFDGDDAIVVDPWDGTRTHLLQRYALANWDLARAIYGARLLKVF